MKYIIELEDEPNESYFGEGNFYRCKQIPYWSISESMRNRLEPYDEADRKDEPTISKMEQVDEPQTDCGDFADRLAYERGVKHAWEVAQKVFNSTVTFYEAENVAKQIDKDINVRSKDEQTETQTETQNSNLTFEKRTMRDCYNCKRYETEGDCIECHYEPKDEPQTEECPFDDAIPCEWVCPNSPNCKYKQKTEPQTEADWKDRMRAEAVIEPQTDCPWK